MKRKWNAILTLIVLFCFLPLQTISGENEQAEKHVLQHFLTIHEIEKELVRIDLKEKKIHEELNLLESKITEQEQRMVKSRERANKIARSYYMGERLDLLLLLLDAESFSELMQTYDYLSYILFNDQKHLKAFQMEMDNLKELVRSKEGQLLELDHLRVHLLSQKELLVIVESELAVAMAGVSDIEKVLSLQEQLIKDWESNGIPTFDLFLQTMSNSMTAVPAAFKDQISFSLKGTKLTITDNQFSTFLKEQSPIFENFIITFDTEGLTFSGDYNNMTLTMKGDYLFLAEDHIAFQIKELIYNGFLLPDSTIIELEQKYDLGIYPNQIMNGLRVKEIILTNGKLEILFFLQLR